MQQIAAVGEETPLFHGHIAGHLLHPLFVRITRKARQANPTALQMNEKEHIISHQALEREDFNRKEVGPNQHGQVSSNEVSPAGRVLSFGGGWDAVAIKDVADRLVG